MKFIIAFLFLSVFSSNVFSQDKLFLNIEGGGKWDKFNYINQNRSFINSLQFDGVYGFGIGLKFSKFNIETGLHSFNTTDPIINFSFETRSPQLTGYTTVNSQMKSLLIPLRLSKEFLFFNDKFFFQPEISFNTIIANNYSTNQPMQGWDYVDKSNPSIIMFVVVYDTTKSYTYRTSKIGFGLGTSLSIGYILGEKVKIYFKASLYNSFYPLYYNTITHSSAFETFHATNTFTGIAFSVQAGVRYEFAMKK